MTNPIVVRLDEYIIRKRQEKLEAYNQDADKTSNLLVVYLVITLIIVCFGILTNLLGQTIMSVSAIPLALLSSLMAFLYSKRHSSILAERNRWLEKISKLDSQP